MTRLEKVLWPERNLTKGDLLRYYQSVASVMLPYLADRPLTFTRWPDGIHGKHFFQKNPPADTPPELERFTWNNTTYLLANCSADLACFVQNASIEIHTWLSTTTHPTRPDLFVLDLDPMPPAGWREVRQVARMIQELLHRTGLVGYPKTSGATGLHIYLAIEPLLTSHEVFEIARRVGRVLVKAAPHLVTIERRIADRHGVYLDFRQNAANHTMIAPYSVRANEHAAVSTPLLWSEVYNRLPQDFTMVEMASRLATIGDLFEGTRSNPQPIERFLELP